MTSITEAANRRARTAQLYSEGMTIRAIVEIVKAPVGTVSSDLSIMRKNGHPLVVPYRKESAARTGFGRHHKNGNGNHSNAESPNNIDALRSDFIAYLGRLDQHIAELVKARDTVADVVRILEA